MAVSETTRPAVSKCPRIRRAVRSGCNGGDTRHIQGMRTPRRRHKREAKRLRIVRPYAISARTRKMLDDAAANLNKGLASVPVNLSMFTEG